MRVANLCCGHAACQRQAREALIDFATWLSEQEEIDVFTPDEAVDQFLRGVACTP